jgi:hypothetical protein
MVVRSTPLSVRRMASVEAVRSSGRPLAKPRKRTATTRGSR